MNFFFKFSINKHCVAVSWSNSVHHIIIYLMSFVRPGSVQTLSNLTLLPHQTKTAVPNWFRRRSFAVFNWSVRFDTWVERRLNQVLWQLCKERRCCFILLFKNCIFFPLGKNGCRLQRQLARCQQSNQLASQSFVYLAQGGYDKWRILLNGVPALQSRFICFLPYLKLLFGDRDKYCVFLNFIQSSFHLH